MKKGNGLFVIILGTAVMFTSCASLNQTAKGSMIGGGSGAAVGAGIGALIGKDGKSAGIGAAIGTAVGAGIGAIIGKKMDKAAEQAAAIEGAKVESITDANDLQAVRVTFDSGILFATNLSVLNAASKNALAGFAKILKNNPTMDISIMGHTDNTGSLAVNQKLSKERAQSVADFLKIQGVSSSQFKEVVGKDYSEPVADNSTVGGRAANRRVEVYMYASKQMIEEAQKEAAK
ncbi:MAG: OmpA family protein [Prevotellaceae bacterium]|jgi:outer membrane protein OmpA-like peptidoglycan-associated protein|nr:OmpA family protein [Prevotellaceae bacterium]